MQTNVIHTASAEAMPQIDDGSVALVVTSPPYNVGIDYGGHDDNMEFDDYMAFLQRVWTECRRVLMPGGRLAVNVANVGRKPYIPLNMLITQQLLNLGFLMRGEIVWNKAGAVTGSAAWGSWLSASGPILRDVHEYIMVFCKDSYVRPDSAGRESTVGRDDFLECTKSIWTMKSESAKRVGHPAPFPAELPRRLIELYTFKDDIVLDPFMGSGTTAVAAVQTKRRYVGYELDPAYADLAEARINIGHHQRVERLFTKTKKET